jgi:hypothetical protein
MFDDPGNPDQRTPPGKPQRTEVVWMEGRSPAQVYALVFGVTLVAVGVIGFFYEASFSTGDDAKADKVFDILAVNGWHNVVHIATGAIGLAVAGSYANARLYAIGFGVVYVALGVIGLLMDNPDLLLDIVPLNDEDNVLHLLIGVAGLGAGLATPATPAPSSATPA